MDEMVREEKVLPLTQQLHYKTFQQLLEQVKQAIAQDANSMTLRSDVAALQQVFRDQLLSLPMDELSLALQHWVQSYQVEIDKQLRLLGMDVLFLQAAKQADTAVQRQQQVCDRLETLQRYCETLLGEGVRREERGERGEGQQGKQRRKF